MDILKAKRTDQRVPEWLSREMGYWAFRDINRVMQLRYYALRRLNIVSEANLWEFVQFLAEHEILHLLKV